MATYTVLTWDLELQQFTPQTGMSVPHEGLTIHGLRAALKDLRAMGYSCHRTRDRHGRHDNNDAWVMVERSE